MLNNASNVCRGYLYILLTRSFENIFLDNQAFGLVAIPKSIYKIFEKQF